MHPSRSLLWLHSFLCVALVGCGDPPKKHDIMDMYELPRVSTTGSAPRYGVDNDSYYVQPTGYKGCNTISDAPSCGGG
jgi:hypothetical protein